MNTEDIPFISEVLYQTHSQADDTAEQTWRNSFFIRLWSVALNAGSYRSDPGVRSHLQTT